MQQLGSHLRLVQLRQIDLPGRGAGWGAGWSRAGASGSEGCCWLAGWLASNYPHSASWNRVLDVSSCAARCRGSALARRRQIIAAGEHLPAQSCPRRTAS